MALTRVKSAGVQSIGATAFPAGSIVKTEVAVIDTFGRTNLNTSTNVDVSGTEKSFTRTFPNSKILVNLNLKWNTYLYGVILLYRKIGSGAYAELEDAHGAEGTQNSITSSGGVLNIHYNNTSENAMGYGNHAELYSYLDDPGTSSDAITYKLQAFSYNSTGVLGLNTNAAYNSAAGYRTVKSSYVFHEIKV